MATRITPKATARRRMPGVGATADQVALARHFGRVLEAPSLIKENGVWTVATSPTMSRVAAAEGYVQGGTVCLLPDDTVAMMNADGLVEGTHYVVIP